MKVMLHSLGGFSNRTILMVSCRKMSILGQFILCTLPLSTEFPVLLLAQTTLYCEVLCL